jgi:regulatory protein
MANRSPKPRPDATSLQEAALSYLSRYAATRATLSRVLERAVARWAQECGAEPDAIAEARAAVRAVVGRLAEVGAVDDAAFAEVRARRLVRAGKSRRAAAAHLAARGVGAEVIQTVVSSSDTAELYAALTLARRRRLGPFRTEDVDHGDQRRELAVFARAGFPVETARAALALSRAEADRLLRAAPE